jgi:hypothetical protein
MAAHRTLLLLAFAFPALLSAQERPIEIGLDGGLEYSFNSELFTVALPLQRVRAAFPSKDRLAFEPALSFTRLSSNGESLIALILQVGALYGFGSGRNTTYARPFAGIEYVDGSGIDSDAVFDLGVGVGSRSRLTDRLALRFEATVTGQFGTSGGTDGALGGTVGLSFFTR